MRKLLLVFALCAVSTVWGFDFEAWATKVALFDREAERLQVAYTNCLANLNSPAENITVPIEHFPDGRAKVTVTASKAQFFLDSGLVWCEGLCLREVMPDGQTERARLEAESCIIDRDTRCGWVQGVAYATYGDFTLEGENIFFSLAEEYIKITAKSKIIARNLKFKGIKL